MENQTTQSLRAPARVTSFALRITILTLDIATATTLAVSLALYHKWIPRTAYPYTNDHTDWTDLIVLFAILVSFMWTIFATLRPHWTSDPLHPGYHVAFEFACLAWLIACSVPAFLLRQNEFRNLSAVSNSCDFGYAVTLTNGDSIKWVCVEHLDVLRKLQVGCYSLACAVAIFHFALFSLACHYSTFLRPTTRNATDNSDAGPKPAAHEGQQATVRESSSSSSSSQPRIEVVEM